MLINKLCCQDLTINEPLSGFDNGLFMSSVQYVRHLALKCMSAWTLPTMIHPKQSSLTSHYISVSALMTRAVWKVTFVILRTWHRFLWFTFMSHHGADKYSYRLCHWKMSGFIAHVLLELNFVCPVFHAWPWSNIGAKNFSWPFSTANHPRIYNSLTPDSTPTQLQSLSACLQALTPVILGTCSYF